MSYLNLTLNHLNERHALKDAIPCFKVSAIWQFFMNLENTHHFLSNQKLRNLIQSFLKLIFSVSIFSSVDEDESKAIMTKSQVRSVEDNNDVAMDTRRKRTTEIKVKKKKKMKANWFKRRFRDF